jgi:tRNA (guanine10-N2)-dimethyltransferase
MEKKLSSFVWRALENPRVKLKGATTSIHVFLLGKIAVCTCLLSQIDEGFEERRPHLRSFAHSGSMHPRLARSLINLTGAKKGDTIMDPCCGSGGLLIEIGLCGMKAEGFDVNRKMVWGSIRNMAQQKLLDYKVTCKDALTLEGKWDYVVTDLPYGLNSVVVGEGKKRLSAKKKDGIKDIGEFYFSFFKMLKEVLGKKGVVVISQLVDGKKLAKDAGLLVEKEFSQYVHGSLTRKILVLTP